MYRHEVIAGIKLLNGVDRLNAVGNHNIIRTIRIVSRNLHTYSFGDTGNVAPHLTVSLKTEAFAFHLRAGSAVIHIAHGHDSHTEYQFGNGIGVLARSIFNHNAVGCGSSEVHIVISGACAHYNPEPLCRVEHFGINDIATYDDRIGIGNGAKQVSL